MPKTIRRLARATAHASASLLADAVPLQDQAQPIGSGDGRVGGWALASPGAQRRSRRRKRTSETPTRNSTRTARTAACDQSIPFESGSPVR